MPKIQVLDKHVAELIAAGEVVERPASVIKELVENSIDAKSSSITVEIRRGGVSFIRVTDNGCGINKEDVPIAFLRHATSKVSTQIDLDSIASLGFRGEALASISAVSHVELTTKTQDDELGTKILMHGGDIEEIIDTGCPKGTTIIVRDIFYNVPARMKFLKKDVSEGNAVASVMDKLALSHPEISFKLIRDHKEVLFTSGDNKLSSAIYGVFGKEFSKDLMPLSYELSGIKLFGYISKTHAVRPNRNMQNFFINGRFIKSRTATVALDEALKGSIPVGKYPACVIHIEMDFSLLDVNVHPAKLDVRFVNEKPIFDVVFHAVKSSLLKTDAPKEIYFKPQKQVVNPFAPVEELTEQIKIKEVFPVKTEVIHEATTIKPKPQTMSFNDSQKTTFSPKPIHITIEDIIDEPVVPQPIIAKEEVTSEKLDEIIESKEVNQLIAPSFVDLASHRLLGEAFKTYIIIEHENGIMFIDKHAAHERLLYEKLKTEAVVYEQNLLIPVTVVLDKQSYDAAMDNIDEFKKVGFSIDDFGGSSLIVRSAPLNLNGEDVTNAIIEISGYMAKNLNSIKTKYMDWIFHNVACRAAIKGGKKSSDLELIHLAKMLEANPELRYCPHGRPVYVMLTKKELEKQFDRI